MLSAVLVHPEQKEVFAMDNEPIIGQDGSSKNDCERNAAKRLLESLQAGYGKEWFVFVMAAAARMRFIAVGLSSDRS